MEKFGSLGDLLGAPPGGIDIGILSEPFNQGMGLLAKCARLLSCKLPLHKHITILIVESTLPLCQYHSFLLSFSGISMRSSSRPSVYQPTLRDLVDGPGYLSPLAGSILRVRAWI